MYSTYQCPSHYAYSYRERSWFDAMIEARNDSRPFMWI